MNYLGKLTILGAVLAASTTLAYASPIQLGSYATGGASQGNANTALTLAGVDLTSGWPTSARDVLVLLPRARPTRSTRTAFGRQRLSNSTWVGEASTAGPGSGSGHVNPGYGYYEFTSTFAATPGTYNGTFNVLADDTVEVLLNGTCDHSSSAPSATTRRAHNTSPAVLTSTEYSLAADGTSRLDASNTLEFIVEQAGNVAGSPGSDPSGVDFNASLSSAATPEPGSLLLLGTGLLGACGVVRRRFAA